LIFGSESKPAGVSAIRGNSHMLMMDRNNLQVAGLIQDWLAKQGLVR